MKLVCQYLWYLFLHNGQITLVTAFYRNENFHGALTIDNNQTSESLLVSQTKDSINGDILMPGSVCLNYYPILAKLSPENINGLVRKS